MRKKFLFIFIERNDVSFAEHRKVERVLKIHNKAEQTLKADGAIAVHFKPLANLNCFSPIVDSGFSSSLFCFSFILIADFIRGPAVKKTFACKRNADVEGRKTPESH